MNQSNNLKLNLEQMREKIDLNYKAIKTTRGVTYVFDILILMIAGLYIFNIDFAKYFNSSLGSVTSLELSNLCEQQSLLKGKKLL